MPIYLFLDLDDTIFQTERKCLGSGALHPAACSKDGRPLSFMTGKQQLFFSHLLDRAAVIPATARSLDAFRRVSLPFRHEAVIDFGGVVLTEGGTPDEQWDSAVRARVSAVKRDLHEICGAAEDFAKKCGLKLRTRIISDFGMDLYIVSKHDGSHPDDLECLNNYYAEHLSHPDMYIHYNDNNLSVIPCCISKASAVAFLIEMYSGRSDEAIVTVGMADSISDAPFMSLCDYSIIPGDCQLMKKVSEVSIVQRKL